MGLRATGWLIETIFGILSFCFAIITILIGKSGNYDISSHYYIALMGIIFVPMIILNALLFIYWLLRRKVWIVGQLLVFIICWSQIGTFFNVSFNKSLSNSSLKVVSYNVRGFVNDDGNNSAEQIISFLKEEQPDIICFQEFNSANINELYLRKNYPFSYIPAKKDQSQGLAIFSKFPLNNGGKIEYEDTGNYFIWCYADLLQNKVKIFNAHLQTTNYNSSTKEINEVKSSLEEWSLPSYKVADTLKQIFCSNLHKRIHQVDDLIKEVQKSNSPIILCGDFNEVPISLTYKKITHFLNDGFKEGGGGYIYTFKGFYNMLRIDYILHSKEFESNKYYSLNKKWSDHNPVFSIINFK